MSRLTKPVLIQRAYFMETYYSMPEQNFNHCHYTASFAGEHWLNFQNHGNQAVEHREDAA